LEDNTIFCYKCDNFYNKQSEGGILFSDPSLAIDWQVPAEKMLVSEKDMLNPLLKESVNNFEYTG